MANISTYAIRTAAGHSFSLSLDANPSNGYQWGLSNPLDSRYLELISSHYAPLSAPSRIGQGGHQIFTFHPLRAGMTSIAFKYCRPWDDSDCGQFTFYVVTIT
ncbi:protease inhibitor I42 family protein [Brevibacillus sp. NRS-1366]|uniref:protease inhibitor I42 family protein n=1 Tax=Brevibacillus sp. NRS-1366 TaxID=3233899 RepID=UPI003D250BE6